MGLEAATAIQLDPALLMRECGLTPDPWQVRALRSEARRMLILAARQSGKSTTVALIALNCALFQERSLILIVSRTERQSLELHRKVIDNFHRLGDPVPATRELTFSLELANGSRIIALPGDPSTIRGFSGPALIVVDEGALVEDALYTAILPMLAVSGGRLVALSTPYGRRGFFSVQWGNADPAWERITAKASECPRIDAAFLEEQRRLMSERDYEQEYECAFVDTIGAVFRGVEQAIDFGRTHEIAQSSLDLANNWAPAHWQRRAVEFHCGVDLARLTDYTAISVLDETGKQIYLERFNKISWERQIGIVKHVADMFRCTITLDVTGLGDPVQERLQRLGLNIYPYHFTHQSKMDLIENLAMLLEQGRLRLLDDPIQQTELKQFEFSQTPTGKVTTSAPPGGHDDMVISLALSAWSMSGKGYYSAGCS